MQNSFALTSTKSIVPSHSKALQVLKQVIEISIVLVAFPLWFPICAVIYLAIWFEDGKNPLFVQERLGKGGKGFWEIPDR